MTTPAALLGRLRAAGATVRLVDGRPRIHAPVALPPDLLAEARANREAVMAGLVAANDPTPMDHAGPTAPCPACGSGRWWRTSAFPTGRTPGPWTCTTCSPPPPDAWCDACAVPVPP